MLSSEVGYTGGESGLLCKTSDGSQTWEFFGVAPSQIRSIAFSPDGSMGWVGGAEGWLSEIKSTGLESQFNTYTDWDAMSFGSNTYGWTVSCFGRKSIYENGTWTYYGGAQYFPCYNDIQFNTPEQAWLSQGGKMLRLRNGTIQHFYEDTLSSIMGVFTQELDTVWAVTTDGNVLMTSNANADTVHFTEDYLSDAFLIDVFAVDGHHAWAIGSNGSLYRYGILEGFPAGGADILDFVVDQQVQPATINTNDQTVHVVVETGTDLTQLIPEIYISAASTIDPPGGSMQDFTNPVTYTVTSENGQTVKDWLVSVDITTSIKEYGMLEFLLYPNPVQEKLTLRYSISDMRYPICEVIDITGRVVKTLKFIDKETTIDLSAMPAGVYLIKLQTEDAVGVQKFIKK
jgi:hypothetical protein